MSASTPHGPTPSNAVLTPVLGVLLAVLVVMAAAVALVGLDLAAASSATAADPMTTALAPQDPDQAGGQAGETDDCLGPDIRCKVQEVVKIAPRVAGQVAGQVAGPAVGTALGAAGGPVAGLAAGGLAGGVAGGVAGGLTDPLGTLGSQISAVVLQGWAAAMLLVWGAGLYVLKLILVLADHFLTPDLAGDGPGQVVYAYTFWIAAALVLVMAMIQLGVAAFRREGKSLARVVVGAAQFVLVWAAWLGYCVVFLAACTGLSRGLMEALLGVSTWSAWDPMSGVETRDITDGVVATVLGLLGLVLWLAALGHLLIMLARAASLLVLVATGPISAAGLVADAGKSWFWKSLRWFHAAALTPVVMVLVLGLGVQLATGVAAGLADSSAKAIGTALPSVMLICVACVAPLSLFKLLAFVDPGTPSGASFRQGMTAQGGIQGLLSGGGGSASAGGSSQAGRSAADGRSAGESGAEASTAERFSRATSGSASSTGSASGTGAGLMGGARAGAGASAGAAAGGALGVAGAVAAGVGKGISKVVGMVGKVGTEGASLMSDGGNQAGVGHHTYGPDFSNIRGSGSSGSGSGGGGGGGGPARPSRSADRGGGTGGGGPAGTGGSGPPAASTAPLTGAGAGAASHAHPTTTSPHPPPGHAPSGSSPDPSSDPGPADPVTEPVTGPVTGLVTGQAARTRPPVPPVSA